jgi:hypothetical protein
MLTVQLPTLLALLGTALMAVVVFAPKAPVAPVVASCAPPNAPPALERWAPPHASEAPEPAWPALIEPSAAGCDRAGRLALIDALGAVRTPWAEAILTRAVRDDPDETVRRRAVAALR